jgi:hypothetical protein
MRVMGIEALVPRPGTSKAVKWTPDLGPWIAEVKV